MFNRLKNKFLKSQTKNTSHDIFTFEKEQSSISTPVSFSVPSNDDPIRLASNMFIADFPEQVLQDCYYSHLFGESHVEVTEDELSQKIRLDIEQLLQNPNKLLPLLPVIPASLSELITQISNKEFDTNQILQLLNREPLVAAKVLKLANSSYYNRGQKQITELKSAFLTLGVDGLSEGILNSFIKMLVPQESMYFRYYGKRLWNSSVLTATYAKQLVASTKHADLAPQAHLLGLTANIGDIIIYQLMVDAFKKVHPDNQPNSDIFKQLIKENSKKLTLTLAQKWQFPNMLLNSLAMQTQLNSSQMSHANIDNQPIGCYLYEARLLTKLRLSHSNNLINGHDVQNLMNKLSLSDAAHLLINDGLLSS